MVFRVLAPLVIGFVLCFFKTTDYADSTDFGFKNNRVTMVRKRTHLVHIWTPMVCKQVQIMHTKCHKCAIFALGENLQVIPVEGFTEKRCIFVTIFDFK